METGLQFKFPRVPARVEEVFGQGSLTQGVIPEAVLCRARNWAWMILSVSSISGYSDSVILCYFNIIFKQ